MRRARKAGPKIAWRRARPAANDDDDDGLVLVRWVQY